MQIIIDLIIGFLKVLILLIGGAMLVGGGSCAAIMLVNSFSSNAVNDLVTIMLIALGVAVAGWFIIKAVKFKPKKTFDKTSPKESISHDVQP